MIFYMICIFCGVCNLKTAQPDAKERTKQKRLKGQSGEDHAGKHWKSETEMKMRQEFM